MDSAPPPSDQLVEAVLAERAQLDLHAERLAAAQQAARDRLAEIDRGLAEVAERQALLERLALLSSLDSTGDNIEGRSQIVGDPLEPGIEASPTNESPLSGPAIRKTAVQELLDDPELSRGIHYRQWFRKLLERGYEVAGKDPLAVFLTQVSRSPVISKTNQPGVYRLDRDAVSRLQHQLDDFDRTLREIGTITSTKPEDIQLVRTRRAQLRTEITHAERDLEEAIEVLRIETPRDAVTS